MTNTAIKPLAYSTKIRGDIVLPAGINLVQRRINSQPHRKLSRMNVSSETTPIWQQQTFRPSATLQSRFESKDEPTEYLKKSISLATNSVDTVVSPKNTHEMEPARAKPTTTPPSADQNKQAVSATKGVEDFIGSDLVLPEPSYLSKEIEENILTNTEEEIPVVQPKRHTQLNATLQQLEETLTNIDNTNMSDLSFSLEQITGLRNKIQEQEQKLQQFHAKEQSAEHEVDVKTKNALLTNLKHALDNTQIELAELEKDPSADKGLIAQLREQLAQQRRSFDLLQREHKELTDNDPTSSTVAQQTNQPTPVRATNQPSQNAGITPKITTVPNAINGTVTDASGKLVTNAIVIIKSSENRPLRALKTNQLGQFWVTTALENGLYMIETEAPGLTFDTLSIELTGTVIPPIAVTAK